MNKEKYNQIIDDAYKNFLMTSKKSVSKTILEKFLKHTPNIHKVEFIDKIKTDERFSEKWGLKIEERGLTYKERWFLKYNETFEEWADKNWKNGDLIIPRCSLEDEWTEQGIPTKVTTVTYNNETIKIYDNN